MNQVYMIKNPTNGRMALTILLEGDYEGEAIKRLQEAHRALRSHPLELMFMGDKDKVVIPKSRYPA